MKRVSIIVMLVVAVAPASSQPAASTSPPPVRQIGPLERMTPDSLSFASISAAISMPGGRVMINDIRGRRVVLLDSTLSRTTVVADTTSATAGAYGMSWATLIRFRGDSALLMVPSTLSMFVIGPTGAIGRVLAIPRPDDAQLLAGTWGVPALDGRGRLVYFGGRNVLPGTLMLSQGMQLLQDGKPTEVTRILQRNGDGSFKIGRHLIDSSIVVRIDLDTRAVDTAAWVRIPRYDREIRVDADGKLIGVFTTPDPLPLIDQWTVLRDGTIAIVRGRDFHIDWIDATGRIMSTSKIPFDWKRVDDARKQALIDSAVATVQAQFDRVAEARATGGGSGGRPGSAGRGAASGSTGAAPSGSPAPLAPMSASRPALSDLPDYFPPFAEHAVDSDLDGNVWIRTTQMIDERPVYAVVNRRGELIDRVQLPKYRALAGFGPGVVYMAVTDTGGRVRLERAKVGVRNSRSG